MKILIAIASYGTGNERYLRELLDIYRSLPGQVDIVVHSNIPRDLGADIEVVVGLPAADPRSLPFGHKRLFAERAGDYDLFIYCEDDTPLSQRNIDAFLRITPHLREDEIAGFMRYEQTADGRRYYPDVHGPFHWHPGSIRRRGPYTLAFFTNEHAACYVLTKAQLRRAIDSGGFVLDPYDGRYGKLETAATDPYTRCGFTKLLCVTHLDDFLVPHLPNKYIGRLGLEKEEFDCQIEALVRLGEEGRPDPEPLVEETRLPRRWFSAEYYADARPELIELVPSHVRRVLSIGCGYGRTESRLIERGIQVTAVPLDPVIAACARRRGVEIIDGGLEAAQAALAGREFDCLVACHVAHLLRDPAGVLASFGRFLVPGGTVLVAVPNVGRASMRWRRLSQAGYRQLGNHDRSGVHLATERSVRRWLAGGGFSVTRVVPILPDRHRWTRRLISRFADVLLASDLVVAGRLAR